MKPLVFVSLPASLAQEQLVKKFMAWMGAQTKTIVIDNRANAINQLLDDSIAGCSLAMSADTLTAMYEASPQPTRLRRFIEEYCAAVLVFGWDDSPQHGSTLTWLTDGAASRVTSSQEGREGEEEFHLPSAGRMFSRQLAGLGFSVGRNATQAAFELDNKISGVEAIMLANGHPAFICLKISSCQLFLLAGSEAPDVDEPMYAHRGIEEHYEQIIPFLIFLRSCFEQDSWHAPEKTARFIIDDPLLADRYGLMEYSTLFDSMRREKYGTSIAFIPWNYRRTSRQWAERLLGSEANLSICVHGCDHTNREFDSKDSVVLGQKARLALARMEKHQERTHLPFESVMVFPQGRFSTGAISALRANNYLAAVNTSCFPTDYVPTELRMADFLRPAITRFHGFPVFQRHYPQRPIDFAFDMLLGKPALLVEHHQYLGDGCKKLEEFVRVLHRIEPKLSWPTLTSQLMGSCWVRRHMIDSFDVQFFTKRFRLKNTESSKCNFQLEKIEPDASLIRAVLVDGRSMSFTSGEDRIRLDVEIEAGETKEIEVVDHNRPSTPARRSGISYSLGVLFRRELSEFRDNALSRHPKMLQATRDVAKRLKMTGDRKV
jgi:hypothetical protein